MTGYVCEQCSVLDTNSYHQQDWSQDCVFKLPSTRNKNKYGTKR